MLTPAYRIALGGRRIDSVDAAGESTLVDLTVTLDLDAPADRAVLSLAQVGGVIPARGEEAAVELGYADEGETMTRVMSGRVADIHPALATRRVEIEGALAPLLRLRVEETYESRAAGAIVRDLAERAGVPVAEAEDGPNYPAYVVDGRRSAWRHLRDLADLAGHDLYADAQGRLVFRRWQQGNTVHVLRRGRDLLALELRRAAEATEAVEAWGESPAGSRGEEAWGWLTDDPSRSRGSAGSGTARLLERPVLRTADAARTAAEAALAELRRRAVRGEAVVAGRAALLPGDAVRLEETGTAGADGTYAVRKVTHRLTKAAGFTTRIGFRATE